MRRTFVAIGVSFGLAACGDPLAGLQKIKDVDLARSDAPAALPTEAEVAREGFLGTDAANTTSSAAEAALEQTATQAIAEPEGPVGAPLSASEIAAAEAEKPAGLLGLLRRAVPQGKDEAPAKAVNTQAAAVSEAVATSQAQVPSPAPASDAAAQTQTAALTPPAAATPTVEEAAPKRSGLFRRLNARSAAKKVRTGPDAQDVTYGTVLPFGAVARVCDAKGKSLGSRVENAAAKGFSLYDSSPGSAGARTWYVTGFADKCPRQLTGANVLLGSASRYEQLHYGPGGDNLPLGATDAAYEGVKRRVCGAGRGRPCGSKLAKIEKSTFFVSAYERFGNSSRWSELLVHDGEVLAAAIKPN